jgi:TRAP-type C4-dicarboxylate transport system substrate-binding protein
MKEENMKKLIALTLALCFGCLGLAACGSGATGTSSEERQPEPASEGQSTEAVQEIEPVELIFATTKNQNSDTGDVISYFCDYVTEASGGSITFNIFWSGTFCGMIEEFDSVSSGAADICALNPLPFSAKIPLTTYPNGTCKGYQGTVDYANYILFENADTASLIRSEFESQNIHYVGFSLNGNSGYYCNFDAFKLEDMAGKKFGTGKSGALQKEYGLNVVSVEDSARYDSLQRSVIDCTDFIMTSAYSGSWQEVTTHWVFYDYVTYGNMFSINLDRWNSLSPEARAIFEEAGQKTLQYSIDRISDFEAEIVEEVQAGGVTVTFVDDADFAVKSFSLDANNALAAASGNDKLDEMKVIITAAADYLDIDISEILARY